MNGEESWPIPFQRQAEQTRGFRWGEVPPTRERRLAALAAPAEPDLGGIAGFVGTFSGTGLNTIFRPQDFAVTPTPLPNPATGPNDNILEINLTEETLSFQTALGSIPNRGMVQGDAFLNGIPYVQKINDVSVPANPVGIHFEPGVWLSVPATTVPEEGATIVRMASIPHGTTIEAQGTSFTVAGGPRIDPVDITPFPIGSSGPPPFKFPSQTATDTGTFRLPQDLTDFIAAGTITQEILDNPNIILKKRADAQNITSTTVNVISTNPADPLFGGGTDNIAFLLGDKNATTPERRCGPDVRDFLDRNRDGADHGPRVHRGPAGDRAGSHERGQPGGQLLGDLADADRRGHHDRRLVHPDPVHADGPAELQPPDVAARLGGDARAKRTRPGGDLGGLTALSASITHLGTEVPLPGSARSRAS